MKMRRPILTILILYLLLMPNTAPVHAAAPGAAGLSTPARTQPKAAAAPVHAAAPAAPAVAPEPPPAPAAPRVLPDFGRMPLHFIANERQIAAPVAYYVQGHDKALYFTPPASPLP